MKKLPNRSRTGLPAAALLALTLLAAPAWSQTAPKVVKKVPMDFPDEAIRKGVDKGVLKARLTVDGAGAVTDVAIIEASPAKARVLTTAVVEALNRWRFEGSGKSATFEMQVVMSAD